MSIPDWFHRESMVLNLYLSSLLFDWFKDDPVLQDKVREIKTSIDSLLNQAGLMRFDQTQSDLRGLFYGAILAKSKNDKMIIKIEDTGVIFLPILSSSY